MLMAALHGGGGAMMSAQAEEERLLQRAIEESKNEVQEDPNSPDVDNMTHEQLLQLQERAGGNVNRGYSQTQINTIRTKMWLEGRTKEDSCMICFEKFTTGVKYKELKCGHEYDADCIDKWLKTEKRCPVCSKDPFQ